MPDELVDVDTGIKTDDVEAPKRLGGPARLRGGRERVMGSRRQQNLARMGDGDQTGSTGERRPDRLLIAHLEITESTATRVRSFTTARAARTAWIGSANTT